MYMSLHDPSVCVCSCTVKWQSHVGFLSLYFSLFTHVTCIHTHDIMYMHNISNSVICENITFSSMFIFLSSHFKFYNVCHCNVWWLVSVVFVGDVLKVFDHVVDTVYWDTVRILCRTCHYSPMCDTAHVRVQFTLTYIDNNQNSDVNKYVWIFLSLNVLPELDLIWNYR